MRDDANPPSLRLDACSRCELHRALPEREKWSVGETHKSTSFLASVLFAGLRILSS